MEKLDSLSKILLATGSINYMAAAIDGVNQQMKMTGLSKDPYHAEGVKEKDDLLAETVEKLSAIMENLGNYMNNNDCICAIDERATEAAFQIVVLGQDETETDYDDLKEQFANDPN